MFPSTEYLRHFKERPSLGFIIAYEKLIIAHSILAYLGFISAGLELILVPKVFGLFVRVSVPP